MIICDSPIFGKKCKQFQVSMFVYVYVFSKYWVMKKNCLWYGLYYPQGSLRCEISGYFLRKVCLLLKFESSVFSTNVVKAVNFHVMFSYFTRLKTWISTHLKNWKLDFFPSFTSSFTSIFAYIIIYIAFYSKT